jgi:hypothetical protein
MSPELVLCPNTAPASDTPTRTIKIIANRLNLVILPPENLHPKNVRSHDFNVRYDGVLRIGNDALDARVDIGSLQERSRSDSNSNRVVISGIL